MQSAGDLRRRLGPPCAAPTAAGYYPIEVIDDGDLLAGCLRGRRCTSTTPTRSPSCRRGFRVLARSATCAIEVIAYPSRRWWGTQFHPELASPEHPDGDRVLRNFFELAGVRG